MKIAIFLILFQLIPSLTAYGKEVLWYTPDWPLLTNNKGSLYSTLFQEIFILEGFTLKKIFTPMKRAVHSVDNQTADFAGGLPKENVDHPLRIQAPFPVFTARILLFCKKSTLGGKPIELDTLKSYSVVSTQLIASSLGLKDTHEVVTDLQAFSMVVKDRMNLYIADEKILLNTIDKNKANYPKYRDADYQISVLGTYSWYMISPRNQRGEAIMNTYVSGSVNLFNSGKIQEIYNSRGYIVPPELKSFAKSYHDNEIVRE
jgi:hypothetical protein